MPIEHIPAEAYRQQRGHVFDTSIVKRIEAVTQEYINEYPYGKHSGSSREEALSRYVNYMSKINPKTSYNSGRIDPRTHKARKLTMEQLDNFLDALHWSRKYFLELILEDNAAFTDVECVNPERLEGWTQITWPNSAMKAMADILALTEGVVKTQIDATIMSFMPESYNALLIELSSANAELGWKDEKLPGYIQDSRDEYVPETKAENMADRIYSSMRYKYNDEAQVQKLIADGGIVANVKRIYHPRHYWVFSPRYLNRICKTFNLSPHWVFFGNDEKTLLCDNAEDEAIMDKFQFLSEQTQRVLVEAFTKAIKG